MRAKASKFELCTAHKLVPSDEIFNRALSKTLSQFQSPFAREYSFGQLYILLSQVDEFISKLFKIYIGDFLRHSVTHSAPDFVTLSADAVGQNDFAVFCNLAT